jgi:hypothetical protein
MGDTGGMDPAPRAAPTEFRYWANLRAPRVRALRAAGRLALGFDPAPADEVVRAFAAMYYDADPLAEAFVDEVYGPRGAAVGRAMVERALAEGAAQVPDAPASLVRMFEDLDQDPAWVDRARVAHGARVFRRWGPDVFRFAGAVTLAAYAESSVAKPLALTGAYAGGSARHRFLETVAFWIAVSDPDGLARGAPGRAAALRVRLMHVFVRRRLLRHPEWDLAAWGVPISQGDAMLTLMGGSFAPGLAMRALGYAPSTDDIEAAMHFWRYVGHLMGVRPRWYPTTMREAWQLAFVAAVKGCNQAGEDGRKLCQAYARAFAPDPALPLRARLRDELDHRVHLGYTRLFVPPWQYRASAMPATGAWPLVPLAQAPLVVGAELARRVSPRLDDAVDRLARWRRERWYARRMGARRPEYRAVETFTR